MGIWEFFRNGRQPKLTLSETTAADIRRIVEHFDQDIAGGHYEANYAPPGVTPEDYFGALRRGGVHVKKSSGEIVPVPTVMNTLKVGRKAVGYAIMRHWEPDPRCAEIWLFSIFPDERGAGYGRLALHEVTESLLVNYIGVFVRCLPPSVGMVHMLKTQDYRNRWVGKEGQSLWLKMRPGLWDE